MGRRHGNKAPVPKTTWAISLEVDEMVSKVKGRHDTIDDFIKKVFEQWLEWRDIISFMEEAYTKQSTRIEEGDGVAIQFTNINIDCIGSISI